MRFFKILITTTILSFFSLNSFAEIWNQCDVDMYMRDSLCYEKFTNEPYDGVKENKLITGMLRNRQVYKKGLLIKYETYWPSGILDNGFKRSEQDLNMTFHEWYYSNGKLKNKFTKYKDDFVGEKLSFHKNGNIKVKSFFSQGNKRGKKKGIWEWFDKDGNLNCRQSFDDEGKEIKLEKFIDEGNC